MANEAIIVNLDDSDDESDLSAPLELILKVPQDDTLIEELENLDAVLAEAAALIVEPPILSTAYPLCSSLLNNAININKINIIKRIFPRQNQVITYDTKRRKKSRTFTERVPFVLVPFYCDTISFLNLKWLKLPRQVTGQDLNILKKVQPAKWIMIDYSLWFKHYERSLMYPQLEEYLAEYHRSVPWSIVHDRTRQKIAAINTHLAQHYVMRPLAILNITKTFYILELCYLQTPDYERGVTGLCLIYCKHNDTNRLEVVSMAGIKLSTNFTNNAIGNFAELLVHDLAAPILVYTPQLSPIEAIFSTNIFPWSGLLLSQAARMYNLMSLLRCNRTAWNHHELCIDADTHSNACFYCNGLNTLFSLNVKDFKLAANSGLQHVLPSDDAALLNVSLPTLITCQHVTYFDYECSRDSIIYRTCQCQLQNE
ncbi:hypothetical protein CcNV_067 [Crangon crangon nudivirus]|uniref:Uncharacterized protein n=1 Tax=Crangon crangon nudivirus TaxID=2880838 RepID=A0AAE9BZR9_9VIRU|nr:hypothetical protein QKT25_gp068 [Crangon crangon nudivirus]UBZ25552.1 hypothetical protein CcNV_067 [Crangon crangon nudivirus]